MAEKLKTIGIVGPVRLSYLSVFKPRANDMKNGELEYSVTLLIPKEPTEFCEEPKKIGKAIKELIDNAAAERNLAKGWKSPLKDGDTDLNGEGEPRAPGYWFIRTACKAEYPPILIDGRRQPVTSGWESGDWGMVKLAMWTYDQAGNKGVSAGLRAVQFLYKDEPLGQSNDPAVVAQEFDEVADADRPTAAAAVAAPVGDGSEYDPFSDSD